MLVPPSPMSETTARLHLANSKTKSTAGSIDRTQRDLRRRQDLQGSFARLQALLARSTTNTTTNGAVWSPSPELSGLTSPSLAGEDPDDDNDNSNHGSETPGSLQGAKGPSRVELLGMTVDTIKALHKRNTDLDAQIACMEREAAFLKAMLLKKRALVNKGNGDSNVAVIRDCLSYPMSTSQEI